VHLERHLGRQRANPRSRVKNLMEFTGASLYQAVAAASRNPSHLMGIDGDWGALVVGGRANITVLSHSAEVVQTFLAGDATIAS
jgi:N-acetylglucosamine-6-phosphate deacetylase